MRDGSPEGSLEHERRPAPERGPGGAARSRVGPEIRLARSGRSELAAAFVLALAATIAIFGGHVTGGGRYLDDWWLGAYIRFPHALGFGSAYDYLRFYSGARPGGVAYWLATYKLFGLHDVWHRALGALLSVVLTTAFYGLLRELRLGVVDAGAIAGLSLVLPVADSIHFWITPDVAQLCLAAYAAGLLLSLRGLGAVGRRRMRLHLAALLLFAVSLLIAETMLVAIALSLLVYLTRVAWRRAVAWWTPEALLIGVAAVHYALSVPARRQVDGTTFLPHAGVLANQALTLFIGTLVPFARARGWVILLLGILAWLLARRVRDARRQGRPATETLRWLVTAGLAATFTAGSYLIYIPSDPSYQPLVPGIGNRINIGALLPLSILVYAVIRLIAGLVGPRRIAGLVAVGLWLVVAVGALTRLSADRWLWDQAASRQTTVLRAVREVLPDPPVGSTLLLYNAPGVVTRHQPVGVSTINVPAPIFSTWWELDAAVKLAYGRPDVDAYPIWAYQPPQIACGAHDIYQLGLDGVRHALDYGRVYLIDVNTPSVIRIDNLRVCTRVTTDGTTIRYDLPV